MTESTLLEAIAADPRDQTAWLALADCLEEQGQPERAELSRLTTLLRSSTQVEGRPAKEDRGRELLARGIRPCLPELTNSIGMRLVLLPPGAFVMGSPTKEQDEAIARGAVASSVRVEGPQHEVEIVQPFHAGVYPVTQEQYERVMGVNPSEFSA